MSKYKFEKGDDYDRDPDHSAIAGIHVFERGSKHGNRIEVYGISLMHARELRDKLLEALQGVSEDG